MLLMWLGSFAQGMTCCRPLEPSRTSVQAPTPGFVCHFYRKLFSVYIFFKIIFVDLRGYKCSQSVAIPVWCTLYPVGSFPHLPPPTSESVASAPPLCVLHAPACTSTGFEPGKREGHSASVCRKTEE